MKTLVNFILCVIFTTKTVSQVCQQCSCSANRVDCSKRGLKQLISFPNTTKWLDLSQNEIDEVLPGAFTALVLLQHLDMSSNNISHLDEGVFQGLSELLYLNLDGNPLSYSSGLSDGVFGPLSKLKELHLVTIDCPQQPLDKHIQNLTMLENFAMLLTADGRVGESLGALRKLDTLLLTKTRCWVLYLASDSLRPIFNLPIRRLSLRNARIHELDPRIVRSLNSTLRKLDLSCNDLRNIPEIVESLRGLKLDTLLLDTSAYKGFPVEISEAFLSAIATVPLRILSVTRNDLIEVDANINVSLHRLQYLQYLRLGYSPIIVRSPIDTINLIFLALGLLYNVKVADASGLYTFDDAESLRSPTFCTKEDPLFSDEKQEWESDPLVYPPPKSFFAWILAALIRLIAENKITLPPYVTRFYMTHAGEVLSISCGTDRMVYPENNVRYIDVSDNNVQFLSASTCGNLGLVSATDVNLQRTGLTSFDRSLFSSSSMPKLTTLNLLGNNLGTFFITQMEGDPFFGMNGVQHLDLSSNGVQRLPPDSLTALANVTVLNLSRNIISTWEASISSLLRLTVLDLSSNQIGQLSEAAFKDLDSHAALVPGFIVNMSSNPISCECGSRAFLQWLLETKVVHHVVECNDGTRSRSLDWSLLRELSWRCEISLVVIAVVAALAAGMTILAAAYACKWRLMYAYYRCRGFCRRRYTASACLGASAQVYISHHDDDTHQVSELRGFFDEHIRFVTRDSFLPGTSKFDQICTHIDNCTVVIFVLSTKSLECKTNEFERYMALEKDIHSVLPIIVDSASVRVDQLPPILRKLLINHNYLRWPSELARSENTDEHCRRQTEQFSFLLRSYLENLLERQALKRTGRPAADVQETAPHTGGRNDGEVGENSERQPLLRPA